MMYKKFNKNNQHKKITIKIMIIIKIKKINSLKLIIKIIAMNKMKN